MLTHRRGSAGFWATAVCRAQPFGQVLSCALVRGGSEGGSTYARQWWAGL